MRAIFALLLAPALASAAPVETKEQFEAAPGTSLPYLQVLPDGYGDDPAPRPLVIFLHGAGERGNDLDLVKKHGPPKIAMQGHGLPFILAAPQCPAGRWWNPDEIISLTHHLVKTLKVDAKRVHLTGISMGGFGTWACLAKEPALYASGVPVCGGGAPSAAKQLKDIPIWAFHGEKDDIVPVAKTREMEDAILKIGGKKIRSTYYPDEKHESWNPAYSDPVLFAWMMLQSR